MKKIRALALLGGFLITLGILAPTWAYSHLAVLPSDLDSAVIAQSPEGEPATYFSVPDLAERTAELRSITAARIDTTASDELTKRRGDRTYVIQAYACTAVVGEDCRTQQYPLAATLSRYAIDESGDVAPWKGSSVDAGGVVTRDVKVTGQTVKFPFHTEKKGYRVWSPDLMRAVPVDYEGTASIGGLSVLRFSGDVAPTSLGEVEVPGSVIGRPEPNVTIERMTSSTTSYLVEPETGAIISASADVDNYATFEGERVLTLTKGSFETPKADAADAVDTYRPLARGLRALRLIVPAVTVPLGLVAVASAFWLAARRRRRGDAVSAEKPVAVGAGAR